MRGCVGRTGQHAARSCRVPARLPPPRPRLPSFCTSLVQHRRRPGRLCLAPAAPLIHQPGHAPPQHRLRPRVGAVVRALACNTRACVRRPSGKGHSTRDSAPSLHALACCAQPDAPRGALPRLCPRGLHHAPAVGDRARRRARANLPGVSHRPGQAGRHRPPAARRLRQVSSAFSWACACLLPRGWASLLRLAEALLIATCLCLPPPPLFCLSLALIAATA